MLSFDFYSYMWKRKISTKVSSSSFGHRFCVALHKNRWPGQICMASHSVSYPVLSLVSFLCWSSNNLMLNLLRFDFQVSSRNYTVITVFIQGLLMETSSDLLSQNTFQTEICWACSVEVSWNGLLTLSWLVGQRRPLFAVTVLLLPVSSACAVWAEQLSLLLPLIIIAATFWITVNSSSHLSDRDAEQEHQRLGCVCRWTSRMPPD